MKSFPAFTSWYEFMQCFSGDFYGFTVILQAWGFVKMPVKDNSPMLKTSLKKVAYKINKASEVCMCLVLQL